MAEYISKDKFIHFLFKEIAYFEETQTDIEIPISATLQSVVNEIKKFTSEDVQPVKHGQWLDSTYKYSEYNYDCSVCGCNEYRQVGKNGRYRAFKYCPECGSKMDEDGET